jgi:hypothetical protein
MAIARGTGNSNIAPRLPVAPVEYDQRFMDEFIRILRLYFSQLDNVGPLQGTTLNLSTINQTTGLPVIAIPTQASLATLRTGDIYYDTTAGNVLKIKT